MKKSIIEKSEQLKSMYVTENPINFTDEDADYKYFIVFYNTHKITRRCKNQNELEAELNDILENGVRQGAMTFF